jgi:3D (Asp-Asp-Asp) domain-containing protein
MPFNAIRAADSQMSRLLRLAFAVALVALMTSCATQTNTRTPVTGATKKHRMSKVRTTAYTHTEPGGRRNAIGKRLSGKDVQSAAADWSRFPLGTKFRIVDTNEIFQIDDYGTALIGTDTIDLYKTNRLAMRKWGVRHVDIDILEWGSDVESLQVLTPRSRHRICKRMILALQEKARTQATLRTF